MYPYRMPSYRGGLLGGTDAREAADMPKYLIKANYTLEGLKGVRAKGAKSRAVTAARNRKRPTAMERRKRWTRAQLSLVITTLMACSSAARLNVS